MKVEQIYTGCLAEAAYYIESDGEVAIIDPLREVAPYINKAAENGDTIRYVLETHFHADFVSGHLDLARKTGAKIVYGPTAQPGFEAHVAKDGEVLSLGKVKIKVLHTPGHTMESSTYLLIDEHGKDYAIFTGDTLFIGDVGRPDLAVNAQLSCEDLAEHLYQSLRKKIMPLADDVLVYPGHGAGSACGKNLSSATTDTLGNQKLFNYALRKDMTRKEFIKEVTEGLVEPPQYFPKNAQLNRIGYTALDDILVKGVKPLTVQELISAVKQLGALILDTRPKEQFVRAFIPGSVWIGLDDKFAPWVGALIQDLDQPIVFVSTPGQEEQVVTRLSRVGYDHSLGYLNGGFDTWMEAGEATDMLYEVSAQEFVRRGECHRLNVLDVRRKSEYDAQHLEGAQNFPLDFINKNMAMVHKDQLYYLHCQGGYRSVIAASILKARGFDQLINVQGGFGAIKNFSHHLTSYVMPQTML